MQYSDESDRSKRIKLTVPARAAVPVWVSYDMDETFTFGNPSIHEEAYGKRLSPSSYAAGVSRFVMELSTNIEFKRFHTPIIYNFLSMRFTFGSSVEGEDSVLILSDIIFDNWAESYEITHIMLWVAANSCVRDGMSLLVVSNPLPLVQRFLRSVGECYGFEFIENAVSESNHIFTMHIDMKAIRLFIETAHATYDVSFKTLAACHRMIGTTSNMKLFSSVVPVDTLIESSSVVSSGYLENFAYFLLKLHRSFKMRINFSGFTDVARVQVFINEYQSSGSGNNSKESGCSNQNSMAVLHILDARPCAHRLQFARIVFWRMIRSCALAGFSKLEVSTAYRHTAALCESLGFTRMKLMQDDLGMDSEGTEFHEDRVYEIRLDTMKNMMLSSQCGIVDGKLREHPLHPEFFELNAAAFPTSDQLNCQADVDARRIL
jgi:hypothetical protein